MKETILSVGIDIGTSTTQLIFSRLTIENRASSYVVPRIEIAEKEVIYRSRIYFTPLLSQDEIDAEAVKKIVSDEYKTAGMSPSDVKTGAVIITGETARKSNASTVLSTLSGLAGDFVVATAGPDLESVLSARGAGTDKLSEEHRCAVANLDIGGGTTNIALFSKGSLQSTSCLDIGGRLIKISGGRITYVFRGTKALAEANGIRIETGEPADENKLYKICELMVREMAAGIHLTGPGAQHRAMYTNGGKMLASEPVINAVTFSGGVAEIFYGGEPANVFEYGDIGVLLARALKNSPLFRNVTVYRAQETIRATVVGAGTHTTSVSGSTITFTEGRLPIKNIPVIKIPAEEERDPERFVATVRSKLPLYEKDGKLETVALVFSGQHHTSFTEIQELAETVIRAAEEIVRSDRPLILVLEHDIAKALGNAVNVLLERKKSLVCIDGIFAYDGDYIDIGEPLAQGRVVPVVTKTLIFNS